MSTQVGRLVATARIEGGHTESIRAFTCGVFWYAIDGVKVWGKTVCSCGYDPGFGDAGNCDPKMQRRLVQFHIAAEGKVV